MSKPSNNAIESTIENWEDGTLGSDEKFVIRAPAEVGAQIDEALGIRRVLSTIAATPIDHEAEAQRYRQALEKIALHSKDYARDIALAALRLDPSEMPPI